MHKKESITDFILILSSISLFTSHVCAEESIKSTLIHKGYKYEYSKIPVEREKESADIEYYGVISVKNREGFEIYKNMTNSPSGCEGNFPAISTISLGKEKREFVVFCGSDGGRHNTLRIVKPYSGIIAQLDFGNTVRLTPRNNNSYDAVVFNEFHLSAPDDAGHGLGWFYLPVFYELKYENYSVRFSDAISPAASEYYEKFIREIKAKSKTKYELNEVLQALFVAAKLNNKSLYCDLFNIASKHSKIVTINNALNEINAIKITCKGEK